MKTFTRREYNLIHNALKNYDVYMGVDDKKLSEIIMDKLYSERDNKGMIVIINKVNKLD